MYAPAQLAALVAVVETGTFDAAARTLHVTPSAVSQRIRALETQVGQVVVSRSVPCRATSTGEVLVTLGRQTALLAAEADRRLGGGSAVLRAAVAVNADSLATWFHDVLEVAAGWERVALELYVEDQAHTLRLLRQGRVLAAVTSDPTPVQGCSVRAIGGLRYHPVVAPALLERATVDGRLDWSLLPLVRFNERDDLQHEIVAAAGATPPEVVHRVPTTADMAEAVRRRARLGHVPRRPAGRRPRVRSARAPAGRTRRRTALLAALARRLRPARPPHRRGRGGCRVTRLARPAVPARRRPPGRIPGAVGVVQVERGQARIRRPPRRGP
ncbi:ArgP/LysG family DNA-binding transcriptional regulator [Nocardioides zeae]|uniref:ArgP/LysG family DNA-binding transcriptional regulator n=1 Tax=Nocardioides zeae TaxID=1457234 RepID=UPI002855CC30|nr:ArgP/LysG family DNA-binding transcriptional regulator [Nocardioides zeae]MDR6174592.1 LysR family transcriptional regulator (chromosome initiation inhibitor) [Nocardioides zeae]